MNGPQNDLDHAAFQRVWRRVMPQDRADCPFTLDAPEEEAQTAAAPVTVAPASEPTPQTTAPAPVGAMTSLAIQTMAPMPTTAPTPTMTPTAAPRQAMPGMAPSPCLGENAAGELPTLEALLAMVREGRQVYKGLTRSARAHTAQATLLADLLAAKEHQLRRLRTAHFLISGAEPDLPPATPRRWPSFPLALRDRYHSEQTFALHCLSAAGGSADPCLIDLYRSLASQSQALAGSLREALEAL